MLPLRNKPYGKFLIVITTINVFLILVRYHFTQTAEKNEAAVGAAENKFLFNWMKNSERHWLSKQQTLADIWRNQSATFKVGEIWNLFEPVYTCPFDMSRVGGNGEGGKWVCGVKRLFKEKTTCIIYSFGVGNDSYFEAELLERTDCSIFAYDPTVSTMGLPLTSISSTPKLQFKQIGLSSMDLRLRKTLKTLMKENSHDWIDLLKMDIEGDEVDSLFQAMKDFGGLPVGQLLVKIHGVPPHTLATFFKLFEELGQNGMRSFSYEPCTRSTCCEYSLINIHIFM